MNRAAWAPSVQQVPLCPNVAEVRPAQGHTHGHDTERAQGEADAGWGEERVGLWHRNSDRLATTTEANPRGKRRVGSAKGALSEGECLPT